MQEWARTLSGAPGGVKKHLLGRLSCALDAMAQAAASG
jgi:hypothetical protein